MKTIVSDTPGRSTRRGVVPSQSHHERANDDDVLVPASLGDELAHQDNDDRLCDDEGEERDSGALRSFMSTSSIRSKRRAI